MSQGDGSAGERLGAGLGAQSGADSPERLLWTIMRRFEDDAARCYERHAPALLVEPKRRFGGLLAAAPTDEAALSASPLARPLEAVLAAAPSDDPDATLICRGLLLEELGRGIYGALAERADVSPATRELAAAGLEAATAARDQAVEEVSRVLGGGDALFDRFVAKTRLLLSRLDSLGEEVDAAFAKRFGLAFADLMGDFAAEVLPRCTGLGMDRRKLVVHFTGALMGAR